MDESNFELAQRLSEMQIEIAMEEARKSKALQPNGRCYNCGERLPKFSGMRWCVDYDEAGNPAGSSCRDDYLKRKGGK